MTKVIFKFSGGPMDGKTVVGESGQDDEAHRDYALTYHGRVGTAVSHRFRLCRRYLDQRARRGRSLASLPAAYLPGYRPHPQRQHRPDPRRVPAAGGPPALEPGIVQRVPLALPVLWATNPAEALAKPVAHSPDGTEKEEGGRSIATSADDSRNYLFSIFFLCDLAAWRLCVRDFPC